MFDQVTALEHCDLGEVVTDLHAHQVAPDRATVALAPSSFLEHIWLEFGGGRS